MTDSNEGKDQKRKAPDPWTVDPNLPIKIIGEGAPSGMEFTGQVKDSNRKNVKSTTD